MPAQPAFTLAAVVAALHLVGCVGDDTYLLTTITRGEVPTDKPIRAVQATIDLDDLHDSTPRLSAGAGGELVLPASLSLELESGAGVAVVRAEAYGDDGVLLSTGSTELVVPRGEVTPVTVELGRDVVLPPDGGVDDSEIGVDPSSHGFGVHELTVDASHVFVVTNSGTGTSQPLSIVLAGTTDGRLALTGNTCEGVALEPTRQCTFTIRFQTSQIGAASGRAEIKPYDRDVQAGVTGSVAMFTAEPAALDFGTVGVGDSVALAVTVTNVSTTDATGPLTWAVTGGDAARFTVDGASTCGSGQALAPQAACTVVVRFAPDRTDSFDATLTVTDRAARAIALVGTSG